MYSRFMVLNALMLVTILSFGLISTIQADCEVMVKLNGAEPYLPTIPTGSGGTSDYSSWQFVFVTPSAGPNSVIAKYLCWDDPNLDRYYTIYVQAVSLSTISAPGYGTNALFQQLGPIQQGLGNKPLLAQQSPAGSIVLGGPSKEEPSSASQAADSSSTAAAASASADDRSNSASQAPNSKDAADAAENSANAANGANAMQSFFAQPVNEICDNFIDDDSDGLVDKDDSDCGSEETRGEEQPSGEEQRSGEEQPFAEPSDSNSESTEDE
jgi:hypothetical protein